MYNKKQKAHLALFREKLSKLSKVREKYCSKNVSENNIFAD